MKKRDREIILGRVAEGSVQGELAGDRRPSVGAGRPAEAGIGPVVILALPLGRRALGQHDGDHVARLMGFRIGIE